MHLRSLRSLAAFVFTASLITGAASTAAAAGDKDKEAMKLYDQAMNEDYLATDFAKAEKKLKDGLKKCGDDKCSAETVGKLDVALGIVYGVGLNKMPEAKAAFAAALKADPKAALPSDLATPELTKAFEAAKKLAKSAPVAEEKPAAEEEPAEEEPKPAKKPPKKPKKAEGEETEGANEAVVHTPPPEAVVNTPVPIYLEASEEQPLSKVTLRYKPFGAPSYKSMEMKKVGKGFGAEIPCSDSTTTGDIKYFFVLTDLDGGAAGTAGSTKAPYKVTIKNEIEGDAPTLPGRPAPKQCKESASSTCPPDFPGCEVGPGGAATGGGEGRGTGETCDDTKLCKSGLACKSGMCEREEGPDAAPSEGKKNVISLVAQFDFISISGQDNVCSGATSSYVCYYSGTATQVYYPPLTTRTGTNGIQGGLAFGTIRPLLGYDRLLSEKVPLTFGARFGVAFPIMPTPDEAKGPPARVDGKVNPIATAVTFPPLHAEARLGYAFLGNAFEHKKFKPYVFVGGGFGQVNGSVSVSICDQSPTSAVPKGTTSTGTCTGTNLAKAAATGKLETVDVYQVTGTGFVDGGAGVTYAITPNFGFAAEIKLMVLVPTFGFALSPNIGPVVAF